MPATVCSDSAENQITVTFFNNCNSTIVEIFWVDGACDEQYYFSLAPGASGNQGTWSTHPWRIRAEDGRLLKEVMLPPNDVTVNVLD